MEETTVIIVKSVLDYGLLGAAVVVLGSLYYRSQAELRSSNTLLLEMTKATTQVIAENTAAMQSAASAQHHAADAHRELANLIRAMTIRRAR